jgi:hypothetical protein
MLLDQPDNMDAQVKAAIIKAASDLAIFQSNEGDSVEAIGMKFDKAYGEIRARLDVKEKIGP